MNSNSLHFNNCAFLSNVKKVERGRKGVKKGKVFIELSVYSTVFRRRILSSISTSSIKIDARKLGSSMNTS